MYTHTSGRDMYTFDLSPQFDMQMQLATSGTLYSGHSRIYRILGSFSHNTLRHKAERNQSQWRILMFTNQHDMIT